MYHTYHEEPVLATCIARFTFIRLHILPAQCIYTPRKIFSIFPLSINRLAFVMQAWCVLCEEQQYLNITECPFSNC